MNKTTVIAVLVVPVLALLMCLAGVRVAMAEATFADVINIPNDILKGPGEFVNKVINTPLGTPTKCHQLTGTKPVVKMLWCAPKPTLSGCRLR